MQFTELRRVTYRCWQNLAEFNGAIVQPKLFKAELSQFGDPRRIEPGAKPMHPSGHAQFTIVAAMSEPS
ncbi:hypothetical protein HC928_11000 [bacterium]|nr:hypothetical protein [bacterium]